MSYLFAWAFLQQKLYKLSKGCDLKDRRQKIEEVRQRRGQGDARQERWLLKFSDMSGQFSALNLASEHYQF